MKKRKRDKARYPVGKRRRRYLLSLWGSFTHKKSFDQVKTFCLFIGYARSGHTLVGSLLDAHPNVVLADELDALKFVQAGFSERQVFYLCLRNSRRAAAGGRQRTGYSYHVPSQWQGGFSGNLQVLGDKIGGYSALRLQENPSLLKVLHEKSKVKIRFVHVIRNPYDVISTMSLREEKTLNQSADEFFSCCNAVEFVKHRVSPANIFDLRHEDFIAAPKLMLQRLCNFFNLSCEDGYLNACASIVFKSPHFSRFEVRWNQDLVKRVEEQMRNTNFFAGYSFDSESAQSSSVGESTALNRQSYSFHNLGTVTADRGHRV